MEAKVTDKYYKIGEVARDLNIAVETIRMYEREGLVIPEKRDSGQRLFNDEDVHWITCIRRLIQEQGLNIEGIRRLLALMPCWHLKPCTESDQRQCPVFSGVAKPCWMIKSQLPEVCQTADCRHCNVYRSAISCENLKRLLYPELMASQNDG